MRMGDLVKVDVVGYDKDIPAIDEMTGMFAYVPKGEHAVFLGTPDGQQSLGGGARILWQGRQMLVQPKALALVQPAQGWV